MNRLFVSVKNSQCSFVNCGAALLELLDDLIDARPRLPARLLLCRQVRSASTHDRRHGSKDRSRSAPARTRFRAADCLVLHDTAPHA